MAASALGFKGIDIRQTSIAGTALVIRASLKNASGTPVTSGTIRLRIFQTMSDGTIQQLDFGGTPAFKSSSFTTAYVAMNYIAAPDGSTLLGLWTYALSVGAIAALTPGGIYIQQISDESGTPTAVPAQQEREFQYGSEQGDVTVTAAGNVETDLQTIKTETISCGSSVTIGAFVGNATRAIAVDGNGYVTFNNVSIATATSVTNGVTLAASQHVIVDSGTVTTLTNLPAAPANWLTDTSVAAGAVTKIQSGLATPTNITAGTITNVTNAVPLPGTMSSDYARRTGDYSTLTQTQVTGGAYDLTNTAYITALKYGLGTIPASGNWLTTLGTTAPANWINAAAIASGAIVTSSFGSCVLPETTNTGRLTSTRASSLDNLDATISSRAAPTDILANTDHKLATNSDGSVNADVDVTQLTALAEDVSAAVLTTEVDGLSLDKLFAVLLASAAGETRRPRKNQIQLLARDGETVLVTLTFNPAIPGLITDSTIPSG